MPKIKHPEYHAFVKLNKNLKIITRKIFLEKLTKARYEANHRQDANGAVRIACILLWMTGARPNEVLRLEAKNFEKISGHLRIYLPGSKGGTSRDIDLPMKDELVMEVWDFVKDKVPIMPVFWSLRNKSIKNGTTRTFETKNKDLDGKPLMKSKHYDKIYTNIAGKFAQQFRIWFDFPVYYLRHNRFTVASERLTTRQLMHLKGAKTEASLTKYLHRTDKELKIISKELTK